MASLFSFQQKLTISNQTYYKYNWIENTDAIIIIEENELSFFWKKPQEEQKDKKSLTIGKHETKEGITIIVAENVDISGIKEVPTEPAASVTKDGVIAEAKEAMDGVLTKQVEAATEYKEAKFKYKLLLKLSYSNTKGNTESVIDFLAKRDSADEKEKDAIVTDKKNLQKKLFKDFLWSIN